MFTLSHEDQKMIIQAKIDEIDRSELSKSDKALMKKHFRKTIKTRLP